MKLQTFTDILRGGNLALGTKLSNLLTEDCTILEYTNDSVLFTKGDKLVLANFKNPLTESKMTSSHILGNEVVEISKVELEASMKETLNKVVECVISENLVDGQEYLDEFCQTYYQTALLRNKYPELFVEELKKNSKGAAIRREALTHVPAFKAELFSTSVISEDVEEVSVSKLISLVESNLGIVLVLGKDKVKTIVTDALLGNSYLAESITNDLYTIAEEVETDSPVGSMRDQNYKLGAGKFSDESDEDLKREEEEIPSVPTEKESLSDDEKGEFEPFNPAMFTEEEIKQLHKTTLKSILTSMQDFVMERASESEDEQVDPELVDQIDADLAALDDEELSDDRLSEIEARWNPMISYFLDSSYHTPADELSDQPLEDQLPPETEEDSTSVDNLEAGEGEGAQMAGAPVPATAPSGVAAPAPPATMAQ